VVITARKLRAGEIDHEAIWAAVLVATGGAGWIWLQLRLPTPQCMLYGLTGIPCPGCGATRGMTCLLHGDFAGALAWNPLFTLGALLSGLYIVFAAFTLAFRLPRIRFERLEASELRWIRWSVISVIAANWAYLLWRS